MDFRIAVFRTLPTCIAAFFCKKYQRLGDRALNTPLFIPQFFLVAKKTFIKFLELNSKNPVLNCIINLLSVFIMSFIMLRVNMHSVIPGIWRKSLLKTCAQAFQFRSATGDFCRSWNIVWCNHSHKKQIVWKHGPNWPFYAFMLRTKLY